MTKPEKLEIAFDNIPRELTEVNRWILWKWENRDGKWTKPPYQASGLYADSSNPKSWNSFAAVCTRYRAGGYDGIGFALSKDSGLVGIDFDEARDQTTGNPKPWAKNLIEALASYTEVSPSRRGFKTLVKGILPGPGHHGEELGLFNHARYFCITGNLLNGHKEIHDRQEVIDEARTMC